MGEPEHRETSEPDGGVTSRDDASPTPMLTTLDSATYHMAIWETPPLYLCLLPDPETSFASPSREALVSHLASAHGVTATPTPLAADFEASNPVLMRMFMPPEPTYAIDHKDDALLYRCLVCERQGQEHHATDIDLFTQHMAQRHGGQMIEETDGPEAEPQEETHAGEPAPVPGEPTPTPPPGPQGPPPGDPPDHPGPDTEPVPA